MRFLCPFLIWDIRQIPQNLVQEYDLGLEAVCFEGADLNKTRMMARQLQSIGAEHRGRLESFHFPTEHADYLQRAKLQKRLWGLVNICADTGVRKIVIHSNHFERLGEFDPRKLPSIRERYMKFFRDIDRQIQGAGVRIVVENMPVIGNNGNDFDSVFVFPEDFQAFRNLKNIGVTWDLGHWLFTVRFMRTIKNASTVTSHATPEDLDFQKIISLIEHAHLSSFRGIPAPGAGMHCVEGIPPSQGDMTPSRFKRALTLLASQRENLAVSLEIKERDYHRRKNLAVTLRWLKDNHFLRHTPNTSHQRRPRGF